MPIKPELFLLRELRSHAYRITADLRNTYNTPDEEECREAATYLDSACDRIEAAMRTLEGELVNDYNLVEQRELHDWLTNQLQKNLRDAAVFELAENILSDFDLYRR